ncbi:threonine/serine exporter ThrE family protein [Streptomyces sp. NPDC090025]|uniref:threonine/serine ThrE exporter family protein n=1 Tax=Streptomyces sp. NPDC090025 TaxID=3365922 RepID=UPI003837A6D0
MPRHPADPPRERAVPSRPWLEQALPRLRGVQRASAYGHAGELLQDDGSQGPCATGVRAVDLALRLGEGLLVHGATADEAVAAMTVTAEVYGLSYCEPVVTVAAMSLSGYPPGEVRPVCASRLVRRQLIDFRRLEEIERVVDRISARELSLEEARERAARVLDAPEPSDLRARWRLPLQSAAVAGAACLTYGGGLLAVVCAALAGLLGSHWSCWLGRYGVPVFYRTAVAAAPAAVAALAVSRIATPTTCQAVLVAGVLGLLPSVVFVRAVRDALTGHHLTALGRFSEAFLGFAAVVAGVLLVLGAGRAAGLTVPVSVAPPTAHQLGWTAVGAVVFGLAVCVRVRVPYRHLPVVGLLSLAGFVLLAELRHLGVSTLTATGLVAVAIGAAAQLAVRWTGVGANAVIAPGIAPLLPGAALYTALTALAAGRTTTGMAGLAQAAAVTIALAVGTGLAAECARLVRRLADQRRGR